jgi:hypothetical protein
MAVGPISTRKGDAVAGRTRIACDPLPPLLKAVPVPRKRTVGELTIRLPMSGAPV